MELWLNCVEFPDNYEVSNEGRIRSKTRKVFHPKSGEISLKSKIMKLQLHRTGYYRVRFCVNGKKYTRSVHRLVAMAFIPNSDENSEVNHIDGNKTNNFVDNLEWVDHSENMQHAVDTLLLKNPCGVNARNSKYVTSVYKTNGEYVCDTFGNTELIALGFDPRNVHAIIKGKQKSHRGHFFKRSKLLK